MNGSDKAFVYTCAADFADGTAQTELLAVRFANADSRVFFLSLCLCACVCVCVCADGVCCF